MSSIQPTQLFQSLQLGTNILSHRLILAPLTRFRADDDHVPLPIVPEYYAQRACIPGTLLISEATLISQRASGYAQVPGIWSTAQIEAWKTVTAAVHAKSSYIYCQLWALGRVAGRKVLSAESDGKYKVVSSSAVSEKDGRPAPDAMTEEEIQIFIQDYAKAARNAIEAGFDGVEIHGANGYLIDQFTQDTCNEREDSWGGNVSNRARFALEVAKACCEAIGADRVGMRLSPWSKFQGMGMKEPLAQFEYIVGGLKGLELAYLHLVESRVAGPESVDEKGLKEDVEATGLNTPLVKLWQEGGNKRPVLLAGGFKADTAKRCVDEQYPNQNLAIVFGRHWISNPDLPFRIEHDLPFTRYDRETFYTHEREGYLDYPFHPDFERGQAKL